MHQVNEIISSSNSNSKWTLIAYHLPFLLQVSLLHQKFHSGGYQPFQPLLRIVRLLLTPLNIWIAYEIRNKCLFTPADRRGAVNLQLACWIIHLVMKSVEWGLVSDFKDNPTYQLRPEFQSPITSKKIIKTEKNQEQLDPKILHPLSTPSTCHYSFKDVLVWSLHQASSLRGINYNWGWQGRKQSIPSLVETLRLMIVSNVLHTIGVIGCVLCRDHGTPKAALLAIGVPEITGMTTIAELLSTLCWGLVCVSGSEYSFCFLTLISHLITFLKNHQPRFVTHLRIIGFLDWWDLRLFVPLYSNPFASNSLASLWGFRWHQFYRRSFIFLGVLPASNFAQKLHLNLKGQRIFGLFGGFLVSATLHEIVIRFVTPSLHQTDYESTRFFPGSLFYFLMQPVGIIIEPYVIRWIPRSFGGGRLWVLMFTLITAWPFKNQYLVHYRVLDDIYPPVKEWPIHAFLWPHLFQL